VIERLHQELGARMPDPRRDVLVEKNPKHTLRIGFLDAAFPDSRIIHLIRDGRDTVASLMFRNRGPSWGHLKIPGWEDLLARYPEENHLRCAYQWRDSVALGREEGLRLPPERYQEIRFEKLVADPAAAVEEAMTFLGLAMTPEVRAVLPRIQDATQGSTMPAARCATTSTTTSGGWAASARTFQTARSGRFSRFAATCSASSAIPSNSEPTRRSPISRGKRAGARRCGSRAAAP
jgi:hypothetical protein